MLYALPTPERLREQAHDWESELSSWVVELGRYVKRTEARERLGAYLRGLLGEIERRNSWQLAEHQGDTRPYGFQHLINRARWDEDGVRDPVRQRVYQALCDDHGLRLPCTGPSGAGGTSASPSTIIG